MKPKKYLSKYKKEMMFEFLFDIGALNKYIFYMKKRNSEEGIADKYQQINEFNLFKFNFRETIEGDDYWLLIFQASMILKIILYHIKEFTDKDIDERINMIERLAIFEIMEKKQKTLTNNIIKFVKNKFRNDIRKYDIIIDDSFMLAWA